MKYPNIRFLSFDMLLGNEPNSIYHQLGVNLTSKDLGKDFFRMKEILDTFSLYNNSLVVGPDVNHVRDCIKRRNKNTRNDIQSIFSTKYWKTGAKMMIKKLYMKFYGYKKPKNKKCKAFKYLRNVVKYSKNTLDAITWHHYYLNGHSCTLNDFLNVDILNSLKQEVNELQNFLNNNRIDLPMWLGETSSAYGGGAPGLSDRYVAGFTWLDKLGLMASLNKNYQVIIRQTFYHGHYALIGEDLYPNPDYWVSLLYKRLVSNNVIRIRTLNDYWNGNSLRLYAHCSYQKKNSITIFGMNLSETPKAFRIDTKSNFRIDEVHHYILTPFEGQLTSREINLNDRPIRILANDSIPFLEPIITRKSQNHFTLPPFSMGFWVFMDSTDLICQ